MNVFVKLREVKMLVDKEFTGLPDVAFNKKKFRMAKIFKSKCDFLWFMAINASGNATSVVCKNCGRPARADEFTLDPIYGKLVCQNCVKERKLKASKLQQQKQQQAQQAKAEQEKPKEKPKPAGWDSDDKSIERAYRDKMSKKGVAVKIDNEKIKYTCSKCSYEFIYNVVKEIPRRCPYCSKDVPKSFDV